MLELTKQTLSQLNDKEFSILLFYAEKCAYCEQIKPIFEAQSENYPFIQFAKIEAKEGMEYYLQYAEDTQVIVYEEATDPNGSIEMKATPQVNEDGSPKMQKKIVFPSFYVHHKAAITEDNKYGFIGGFDGASEEELLLVCGSLSELKG